MPWVDYLVGGSGATVISSGIGAVVVKVLKRVATDAVRAGVQPLADDVAGIKQDLSRLDGKLASETGGNSNGLRQKVNEVDAKVDRVAEDVAFIKGKTSQ